MKKYDAIVIGAGHNGLTNGAYLAKAGLDVLIVEKNTYIGGATVSRELHEGWKYSNCSYVCSLLRPEISRDSESAKTWLASNSYVGGVTFTQGGDYLETMMIMRGNIAKWLVFPSETRMLMSDTPQTLQNRRASSGHF